MARKHQITKKIPQRTRPRRLTVSMDLELAIRIDVLAAKSQKPKGDVIVEALERYVSQEERKHA